MHVLQSRSCESTHGFHAAMLLDAKLRSRREVKLYGLQTTSAIGNTSTIGSTSTAVEGLGGTYWPLLVGKLTNVSDGCACWVCFLGH
jgi:hypothetical protein